MQINSEGQDAPPVEDKLDEIADGLTPRLGGVAEIGTHGERVARCLRGSVTTGMTTDQIMALTRGE